jgi:hypothetical protein
MIGQQDFPEAFDRVTGSTSSSFIGSPMEGSDVGSLNNGQRLRFDRPSPSWGLTGHELSSPLDIHFRVDARPPT